jgi:hypothetical protein
MANLPVFLAFGPGGLIDASHIVSILSIIGADKNRTGKNTEPTRIKNTEPTRITGG